MALFEILGWKKNFRSLPLKIHLGSQFFLVFLHSGPFYVHYGRISEKKSLFASQDMAIGLLSLLGPSEAKNLKFQLQFDNEQSLSR